MKKRLFKNALFRWIVVRIVYGYSQFVYRTTRWERHGQEHVEAIIASKCPIIVILWHGRILLAPKFPVTDRNYYAVISLHGDGQYVAGYMERHHVVPIRGSSKKGALNAFKQALRVLKKGNILVVTPDGPRGPGMKWGGNAVALAKLTGAVIVPYAYATNRCRFLKSWDRFCFPFPFGKGVYIYGEAMSVSSTATEEEMLHIGKILEARLNTLTRTADDIVGIDSVVPRLET